MPLYSFKSYKPEIDKDCFIAPGAMVIGRVSLSKNVSIWHNCVLRGDVNSISIGECSNIQDLSMCHVTEKSALIIEENVTVGHSVTLHGCTIKKNSLIGMGATILDDAVIGEYCIVAAQSIVPPGKVFPPKSLIMGSPAKVIRNISEEQFEMLNTHYKSYLKYKDEFISEVELLP